MNKNRINMLEYWKRNWERTLGKKLNCDCVAGLGGDFSGYLRATEAGE